MPALVISSGSTDIPPLVTMKSAPVARPMDRRGYQGDIIGGELHTPDGRTDSLQFFPQDLFEAVPNATVEDFTAGDHETDPGLAHWQDMQDMVYTSGYFGCLGDDRTGGD
jgi:hypothetical protein